jgi:ABC-type phosphate transport system auxiliary subunit
MGIADVTQAQLAREQWERYKSAFLPMLENLSQDLMTNERLKEQLEIMPEQVDQSFAQQQSSLASQRERMGLSGDMTQAAQTQTDIEKAKAQSSSQNLLRQSYSDMKDKAILGAGGGI